jgi:(p)ppGpp synthase/HD superfamily hydrolase
MGMTIEEAIAFAARQHAGLKDKAGETYIWHPLRVALRLDDADDRMAAVLHDVVEDTGTSFDDLRALGVPEQVVTAIDHLTRRPEEDYLTFIRRVKRNPIARRVKLADLRDNSDPVRLAKLGAETQERLRRKYGEALAELEKD